LQIHDLIDSGLLYNQTGVCDPFEIYYVDLAQSDLDDKSKGRYRQIVSSYGKFLNGRPPDFSTAKEFLAYLWDIVPHL